MGDISDVNAAQSVKIIGSSSDGTEGVPVRSTASGDSGVSDETISAGTDTTINLAAAASQEAKVGASAKADRKYISLQALDKNFKWGHTAGSQPYDAFKNQLIILPYSAATPIFILNDGAGAGDIVVGEA